LGSITSIPSSKDDGDDDVSDHSYLIEIVRQGQHIGLRSPASGGRFLQPRRKHPHRLIFFSAKLGIWEQWEVEGEEAVAGAPWKRIALRFRSRRLPSVVLDVDVARVGFISTGGSGGLSQVNVRQRGRGDLLSVSEAGYGGIGDEATPGLTEDIREDEQLNRINTVFVHEWIR
jgi:hypothetical protein